MQYATLPAFNPDMPTEIIIVFNREGWMRWLQFDKGKNYFPSMVDDFNPADPKLLQIQAAGYRWAHAYINVSNKFIADGVTNTLIEAERRAQEKIAELKKRPR